MDVYNKPSKSGLVWLNDLAQVYPRDLCNMTVQSFIHCIPRGHMFY